MLLKITRYEATGNGLLVLIIIAKIVKILFRFIKRVDEGQITIMKDLESFHNVLMADVFQ